VGGIPFVQHKASLAEWLLHGFEHGHLACLVDVGRNGGLGCASSLAVREYTETRRRRGHRCSRRVGWRWFVLGAVWVGLDEHRH